MEVKDNREFFKPKEVRKEPEPRYTTRQIDRAARAHFARNLLKEGMAIQVNGVIYVVKSALSRNRFLIQAMADATMKGGEENG